MVSSKAGGGREADGVSKSSFDLADRTRTRDKDFSSSIVDDAVSRPTVEM
jgi:hypothetical protein